MSFRLPSVTLAIAVLMSWTGAVQADPPKAQDTKDREVLRFGLAADTNVSRQDKTTAHWNTMIELGQRERLDFIVIAGDIVNNAKDQQQWDRLKSLLRKHRFKVETVPGNHEVRIIHEDREDVFNRIYSLDRYEQTTRVPVNRAFRYANAYFITFYSGGLERGDTGWADFLKEHLAYANADDSVDWVFVVDHLDPESISFPHAVPKFGGFDRAAIIEEAIADQPNLVWLSGDLSSRYQHSVGEKTSPRAEFIPRENRAIPGFWRFELYADGRLTAQIVNTDTQKKHALIEVPRAEEASPTP
ncbi:MAG: metallophosphoesterase family protein [Planctomycetota bacterium]